MPDLPSPITVTDFLTKAVLDRLGEQNELLRQLLDRTPALPAPVEEPAAAEPEGPVLVTEPAPARRPGRPRRQASGG